jgi:hypothetical protein
MSSAHRVGVFVSIVVAGLSAGSIAGCLRRDVSSEQPTTKISFDTVVPQPAIDKVDLLVMVDNSSSMADKQKILADAVPDLLKGLVQPKCVDKKTRVATGALADPLKAEGSQCAAGSEPAFAPITDMHIGIISSSLGGMGSSSTCQPDPKHHNDDHGHLISRGPDGQNLAQAGDLNFLAWYPDVLTNQDKKRHPDPPVPATSTIKALGDSFHDLVVGVGQDGCGLEAQLESIYRFLVQPNPWTGIQVTNGQASYGPLDQVDGQLLKQRAAFLRPDSLVAVVLLSDEDDSSADPLAFQGSAWRFENASSSPNCSDCEALPRGTAACASNPAAATCTSCQFAPMDPSCSANGGFYTAEQDPLNVRFYEMKRRFGVDPQFPISRYVDAFTKKFVPSRQNEHANGSYVGKTDCTNPLFAAKLPASADEELCNLPKGTRTSDLVYFAVIGGVPNTLLPASGDSSTIDWTKLLGKNPAQYDETGIDPHMLPSTTPRKGLPPPTAADDADPVNGREWDTGGTDLEFACTFPLYELQPDGTSQPARQACPTGSDSCDCDGKRATPLCDKTDPTIQVKGKAYPTRRELMVAQGLGDHAVVASLCPKQLSAPGGDDYGYRPAVRAITDRLEGSLTASCLPRALARDPKDGTVSCLVLATLPDPGSDAASCAKLGLDVPRAEVLDPFRDRVAAENGEDSRKQPVCEIPQLAVAAGETCRDEDQKHGFCYVENVPGVSCAQALLFTKPTTHLAGVTFAMQCITVGVTEGL